jgi:hypothetical protein
MRIVADAGVKLDASTAMQSNRPLNRITPVPVTISAAVSAGDFGLSLSRLRGQRKGLVNQKAGTIREQIQAFARAGGFSPAPAAGQPHSAGVAG